MTVEGFRGFPYPKTLIRDFSGKTLPEGIHPILLWPKLEIAQRNPSLSLDDNASVLGELKSSTISTICF